MAVTAPQTPHGTIVETYHFQYGKEKVTVNVMADAYMNEPPEEIERRIKHMQQVAAEIIVASELKKLQEKQAALESGA